MRRATSKRGLHASPRLSVICRRRPLVRYLAMLTVPATLSYVTPKLVRFDVR